MPPSAICEFYTALPKRLGLYPTMALLERVARALGGG